MPDASCRIRNSSIQSMATMLLSMTSLYPDADLDNHPRICVIFNNVSKFQTAKKMTLLYGEESHELKKESFEEEKKDNLATPPTAAEYILKYKKSLLDYMMS